MSELRMNKRKRKYPVGMGDHIDLWFQICYFTNFGENPNFPLGKNKKKKKVNPKFFSTLFVK